MSHTGAPGSPSSQHRQIKGREKDHTSQRKINILSGPPGPSSTGADRNSHLSSIPHPPPPSLGPRRSRPREGSSPPALAVSAVISHRTASVLPALLGGVSPLVPTHMVWVGRGVVSLTNQTPPEMLAKTIGSVSSSEVVRQSTVNLHRLAVVISLEKHTVLNPHATAASVSKPYTFVSMAHGTRISVHIYGRSKVQSDQLAQSQWSICYGLLPIIRLTNSKKRKKRKSRPPLYPSHKGKAKRKTHSKGRAQPILFTRAYPSPLLFLTLDQQRNNLKILLFNFWTPCQLNLTGHLANPSISQELQNSRNSFLISKEPSDRWGPSPATV